MLNEKQDGSIRFFNEIQNETEYFIDNSNE